MLFWKKRSSKKKYKRKFFRIPLPPLNRRPQTILNRKQKRSQNPKLFRNPKLQLKLKKPLNRKLSLQLKKHLNRKQQMCLRKLLKKSPPSVLNRLPSTMPIQA